MNIGELIKGVAEATGSSDAEAKKAITAVFDQIATAAAKGDEVSIPGFGKFAVKDRPDHDSGIEEGGVHTREGSERQALRHRRRRPFAGAIVRRREGRGIAQLRPS